MYSPVLNGVSGSIKTGNLPDSDFGWTQEVYVKSRQFYRIPVGLANIGSCRPSSSPLLAPRLSQG